MIRTGQITSHSRLGFFGTGGGASVKVDAFSDRPTLRSLRRSRPYFALHSPWAAPNARSQSRYYRVYILTNHLGSSDERFCPRTSPPPKKTQKRRPAAGFQLWRARSRSLINFTSSPYQITHEYGVIRIKTQRLFLLLYENTRKDSDPPKPKILDLSSSLSPPLHFKWISQPRDYLPKQPL